MKNEVYISVDRDSWTNGLQLSINDKNEGFRLTGPKYNGSSKTLIKHTLDKQDIDKIRYYLRKAKKLLRNVDN